MLLMIVTMKPKVNVPFLQKMKILRSYRTEWKVYDASKPLMSSLSPPGIPGTFARPNPF